VAASELHVMFSEARTVRGIKLRKQRKEENGQ